jgi:hypothetical protein
MQPVLPPHDPTGFPADALALVVSPVNVTTSGNRWSCLQPVPGSAAGDTSSDEDDSDDDGSASSLPFPLRWGLPSRGRGGPSALLPLLSELLAPPPLLVSPAEAARPCNSKVRHRARDFQAAQTRGLLGAERCMADSFSLFDGWMDARTTTTCVGCDAKFRFRPKK